MIVLRVSLCVIMVATFSVLVGVFRFGVVMAAGLAANVLFGRLLFLCVLMFVLMIATFSVLVGVFRFGVIMRAVFAVNMLLGRLLFLGLLVFVLMVAAFSVLVGVFFGDGRAAPRDSGKEKGGNFQKMFLVHGFFSKWWV